MPASGGTAYQGLVLGLGTEGNRFFNPCTSRSRFAILSNSSLGLELLYQLLPSTVTNAATIATNAGITWDNHHL